MLTLLLNFDVLAGVVLIAKGLGMSLWLACCGPSASKLSYGTCRHNNTAVNKKNIIVVLQKPWQCGTFQGRVPVCRQGPDVTSVSSSASNVCSALSVVLASNPRNVLGAKPVLVHLGSPGHNWEPSQAFG